MQSEIHESSVHVHLPSLTCKFFLINMSHLQIFVQLHTSTTQVLITVAIWEE